MNVREPTGVTRSISTRLLQRVQSDDLDAWQRMVTLFGPVIYRWCRHSGLQPDDAADVGQEVLQAIHRKIGNFRRERAADTFRGWLWMVTKNKIRDFWRRQARSPQALGGTAIHEKVQNLPDLAEDDPDRSCNFPTETVFAHEALELVKASFEPNTWQAFWRVTVEDQRAVDVAADLEMTVAAVYQAKSRIMRRLRQELAELVET